MPAAVAITVVVWTNIADMFSATIKWFSADHAFTTIPTIQKCRIHVGFWIFTALYGISGHKNLYCVKIKPLSIAYKADYISVIFATASHTNICTTSNHNEIK